MSPIAIANGDTYEVDHEGCGLMLEAIQEHLRLVEVRISSSYHRYQH